MYKFKFADIGEGLHEGVVAEIYKKEGDEVKEGDSLFSVETDKVTSDIPSPKTGKIVKIFMAVGDTIHVGQDIYYIDDGSGDDAEEAAPAPAETKSEEPKEEESGASVVGEVKVSNELFSFGFSAPKPAPAIAKPVEKTVEVATTTSAFDKGKAYTGKVDEEFDVIVIGSGPGGYLAAEEAGGAGLKTLIVEKEFWGGVCLNVGCIPTKALLKSTEVLEYVKHAEDYGVDLKATKIKLNWEKIHERKRAVVKQLTAGVQALMRMNKVKTELGEAKFVGAHEISVGNKVFRGKHIIIATGSSDRKLPLPGFEQGYASGKILTSKEAINLDTQPKSLTIIGGGVIGVEFAQVFSATGAKVTILQNLPKILNNLDDEIIKEVEKKLVTANIEVITNSNIKKFEDNKVFYEVDGKEQTIESDFVLVSVGRAPESLGLEEVGIKLGDRKQLLVDDKCRTNVENVYGIGDVTGQAMLAHVAYRHAVVAVSDILAKDVKYNDKTIPACIYTHPEIAVVGLTEKQAKDAGKDVFTVKHEFKFIGKAIASGDTTGFAKFVIDKKYGEIVGCHIIGPHATDLISEIVVAIDLETTIFEIASSVHPHPTFSEVLWEAARTAVHKLNKK